MLVNCYLPGNRSAPPPAHLVHGLTGHTEEEQSLFDPPVRPVGGRRSNETVTKISVKWTPVWLVCDSQCEWRSNETVTKSLMNNDLLCG